MASALSIVILAVLSSSAHDITAASAEGSGGGVLMLPALVYRSQVGFGTLGRPAKADPESTQEVGDLSGRLAALEASTRDSSAWATILVGVVTLLVAGNIGLSVWQVGSIARKEAEAIIVDYNEQFSGFLTRGQHTIAETLARYEESISDLSRRLDAISARIERYAAETSSAKSDIQREAVAGLVQLHATADRLRADIADADAQR
jgi:hypothetical protein